MKWKLNGKLACEMEISGGRRRAETMRKENVNMWSGWSEIKDESQVTMLQDGQTLEREMQKRWTCGKERQKNLNRHSRTPTVVDLRCVPLFWSVVKRWLFEKPKPLWKTNKHREKTNLNRVLKKNKMKNWQGRKKIEWNDEWVDFGEQNEIKIVNGLLSVW